MTRAARIWMPTTTFISICILLAPKIPWAASGCRLANRHEIRGLEGRPPDQAAVNVSLGKQLCRVVGLHAATIKNQHLVGLLRGRAQLGAQHRVNRLSLL